MKRKTVLLMTVAVLAVIIVSIPSASRKIGEDEESPEAAGARLVAVLASSDPRVALETYRILMEGNVEIARDCHPIAHDLGRAAYAKYGDFGEALSFQDEICNSGYIHGVIEAFFMDREDAATAAGTVCDAAPSKSYQRWSCYHGIGHGHMYASGNDLPSSLAACERYEDEFARGSCVNGVFMENFNADEVLHPTEFLRSDDPFFPCPEQADAHRADCYLYAPTWYLRLHSRDYLGALAWCMSAGPKTAPVCVRGVGMQATKENIDRPEYADRICSEGAGPFVADCVSGLASLYINHYGDMGPAVELCGKIRTEHRAYCESAVADAAPMFASK